MSRVKRYDFEKHSILDIKEYLENRGYKTQIIYKNQGNELHVVETDIFIDFPIIIEMDHSNTVLADIRFASYPRTKNYEKSKKLYQLLKRKFAVKKGVFSKQKKTIKDYEQIKSWVKDYRRSNCYWIFRRKIDKYLWHILVAIFFLQILFERVVLGRSWKKIEDRS